MNIIKKALGLGFMVLAMAAPASAQAPITVPPCSPYDTNCAVVSHRFANVFVRVAGLELTNVTLTNTGNTLHEVMIDVVIGTRVVTKTRTLLPFERIDEFITDASKWPEIADHSGGASVLLRTRQAQNLAATVTMHPEVRVDDSPSPEELRERIRTFWRQAKLLEGGR